MRNYRFTLNKEDKIEQDRILVTNPDLVHQITNVLRLAPGHKEELSFIDNSAKVYDVQYQGSNVAEAFELGFQVLAVRDSDKELKKQVKFYIPVIKPDTFMLMIRKLTELGVQDLQPVVFERSQKQNLDSLSKDNQRRRVLKTIEEATEQCEGAVLAKFHDFIQFSDINEDFDDTKIFASEWLADSEKDFSEIKLSMISNLADQVKLLVGPEGGLTVTEVERLVELGFQPYSLGKRLLKAETAAIALFSSLHLA